MFRYSGYNVMNLKKEVMGGGSDFSYSLDKNVFAVAKIGKPNLIKPVHLDLEVRAISNYHQYIQHCD